VTSPELEQIKMKAQRHFFAAWALSILALVSCAPKAGDAMLGPSQALGAVLAGETALAAGTKKQIVLILPRWASNSTAGESFKAELKRHELTVACTLLADVGDPMGRTPPGFKTEDFFDALEKGAGAGAIVSLAGAPLLDAPDMARMNSNQPPVLVVASRSLGNVVGVPADGNYLATLLDAKVVQLAIVDGKAEPDAAPAGKMDATQQLFFQHYSIFRSDP
jgi:hypothetical protein